MGANCCSDAATDDEIGVNAKTDEVTGVPATAAPPEDNAIDVVVEEPRAPPKVEASEPQIAPSEPKVEAADTGQGDKADETQNNKMEPEAEQQPQAKEFNQDQRFEEVAAKMGKRPESQPSSLPRRPSSVGTDLQKYVASHEAGWEEFSAMEPMDGWSFNREEQGVKIYTKQNPGSPLLSFKAVIEIECDPDRLPAILKELLDIEKRPQWDKMCLEAKAVESYTPFYRITYVRMQSPAAVISNRDLCLMGRIKFTDDGGVMLRLQSVEHPDAPVAKSHVRCEMTCGGYLFRPVPGKKLIRMMYMGTVDPKGWLPMWVANKVAWKQGLALALFKDSLRPAGIL